MGDEDDVIPEGYIRVTEVLEPFKKLNHIDPLVLENAANRGKRVHKYCEFYAQNLLVQKPDDECEGYVQSYIDWHDRNMLQVFGTEERLNHPILKISGKYDLVCSLNNHDQICLVDLKTPQTPSITWPLQTAAYQLLLANIKGLEVKRMCLILDKNGKKAKEVIYTDNEKDQKLYLSALELYNYFNKRT